MDRIVVDAPRSSGHFLPVAPLEVICRRADDFGDDEGSLPRGRVLVHAICFLDTPKDEVANVEGSFLNVAIKIASELLVMTGLSHDNSESLFFEAVEVDATCLLGLSFLVELDAWSSKGDVGK
jgi:hypothetical protein